VIGTTIALALAMQDAGQGVVAIRPDAPQTWALEYPIIIRPYVTDYYDCLKLGTKYIDGKSDFEGQHRLDIPRCAKKGDRLLADAKARIARSKKPDQMTDQEVDMVFETIRQIHIARGRDIDLQVAMRLEEYRQYHDAPAEELAPPANQENPRDLSN
jgi:hypothetical protein